ncbi:MAG: aspartate aminotransferase family protein [Chloroflexi bacterium]|nr:aspartate aminotransferase family protein [Chloroflexota bacterium]MDA1145061.1 aspartate aminotransferase family protein [Chloroflexota bacterium]MQC82946.1 aspartate aminotransferase family protein [Chloroflexota bacterium]PKB56438.1 MAG: aspartate aminotransferase family protein [SAR202 cluster bacterium Casp-Chloro-G1]
MQTGRRLPITLVRGEGTRVWDDEGNEYLDFIAGIASDTLGHADEGLAEVISKQARTLIHVSNIFYTVPQIELGEWLIEHSVLDRVFFANSGAEANEAAIKLARKWGIQNRDGAYEIISTHNSFHGRTLTTVAATGTPAYREPFGPPTPGFVFVDYNSMAALREATTPRTAAIMLEPIQGEGGVNVPDADYLKQVRAWCDEQGILLILDEIQTGIGRTGTVWAYEQAGVEPDIMTSAKGIAGGVPLGAVLAKEHACVFVPGDHGSTFGGNPLATAAGAYVVRQLHARGVLENAKARGQQLSQRLAGLEDRHPLVIGEAGGGLLRRLELAEDVAGEVATKARERGLLLNPVRPNRVRFMPPLTVTAAEIDQAVDIVEAVLTELEAK